VRGRESHLHLQRAPRAVNGIAEHVADSHLPDAADADGTVGAGVENGTRVADSHLPDAADADGTVGAGVGNGAGEAQAINTGLSHPVTFLLSSSQALRPFLLTG
jgi:hypothetical protein